MLVSEELGFFRLALSLKFNDLRLFLFPFFLGSFLSQEFFFFANFLVLCELRVSRSLGHVLAG